MARVVVTGGAGFLGSHLCRSLLERGDEVVCLDNLVTGTVDNISELFGRTGFTFVVQDVSSYVWVPGDGRRGAPLRESRVAARLPRPPDPDPQGRVTRNPQHPWVGQGQAGPLPAGLHQRGLRRPAGAPAERVLLGPREPDRPTRGVRRGQALRRGDDDGLPPHARPGRPHRPHLQHLRPAHARGRRPGRLDLRHERAAGRPVDAVRRRDPDAQLLLRGRHRRRVCWRCSTRPTSGRSTSGPPTSTRWSSWPRPFGR